MHWDRIQGRWPAAARQAHLQWPALSDDDLHDVNGQRDRLVDAIQVRYGVTRAVAERQVVEWQRSAGESWFRSDTATHPA